MKKFLFACLLALLTWTIKAQSPDVVKVGDTMPDFTILSDDGSQLASASLKGKVILITFFATWCPPCQKELPEFERTLWPQYKANDKFRLLVIGREHTDADLKKYNERKGFTFPLYPDKSRAIYGAFANSLIPRNYLVGKNGKILYASSGYSEADFTELLKQLNDALK